MNSKSKKLLLFGLIPVVLGGLCLVSSLRAKSSVGRISLKFPQAQEHRMTFPESSSASFLQKNPVRRIDLNAIDTPGDLPLGDPIWLEWIIRQHDQTLQQPLFSRIREIHKSRFHSGGLKGQYLVTSTPVPNLGKNEMRTLTFLKYGSVYTVSLKFLQTNSLPEQKEIEKTWKSLLQQLGIDPKDLSLVGASGSITH